MFLKGPRATMRPVRLQLSRVKGFDLKHLSMKTNGLAAVVVTRPGRWGNPWVIGATMTAVDAVARYRAALVAGELPYTIEGVRHALRGRNLACWCKIEAACHG